MDALEAVLSIAAAASLGLMAGVFWLYAHSIMPGLRGQDDRTFVGAFQGIDGAIINPMFMATFFGALLLSGAAALVELGDGEGAVAAWSAVACGLYLLVVAITVRVHVPLNDGIKGAGDPDRIDVASVRSGFEAPRVRWNLVRTVLCTASFACSCWALVELGQTA